MPDPGCREDSAETVPESVTPQFQPGSPSHGHTPILPPLPRVPLCTLSLTSVFLATPNVLTRLPQAYSQVHSPLHMGPHAGSHYRCCPHHPHTYAPFHDCPGHTLGGLGASNLALSRHPELRLLTHPQCKCEVLLKGRVWATSYLNRVWLLVHLGCLRSALPQPCLGPALQLQAGFSQSPLRNPPLPRTLRTPLWCG